MSRLVATIVSVGLVSISILQGCNNRTNVVSDNREEKVVVKYDTTPSSFFESVKSFELVPLDSDDSHLLGSSVSLLPIEDGTYILTDRRNSKVYRFSSEGKFLNSIGQRGNGPGEYTSITDVQTFEGTIHIFNAPDEEIIYLVDGTFKDEIKHASMGTHSFRMENGLLSYYGYTGRESSRLIFWNDSTSEKTGFLPVDAKVLSLDLGNDIFCKLKDNSVCLIESFAPEILKFKDDTLSRHVVFDFGKYSIPESYFKHSSAFDAAEELFSSDYAIIASYMEDQDYKLVQLLVKDKDSEEGHSQYGLYAGKDWKWFSLREFEPDPSSSPFKTFYNNVLYALFEPSMLIKMENHLGRKIINKDILKDIAPDSDYVIAKINFNQ